MRHIHCRDGESPYSTDRGRAVRTVAQRFTGVGAVEANENTSDAEPHDVEKSRSQRLEERAERVGNAESDERDRTALHLNDLAPRTQPNWRPAGIDVTVCWGSIGNSCGAPVVS